MEYCPAIKKNEIRPFVATWMDLETVILSEVKLDREGEVSYEPYMWNLKRNDTNVLTYRTERDSQTEKTNLQSPGWWGPEEGGIIREFGMVLYTLLYLKLIIDRDLLYSTCNSAQCSVAAWMGGKCRGEWIHVHAWLSPFAVPLKLSQHC